MWIIGALPYVISFSNSLRTSSMIYFITRKQSRILDYRNPRLYACNINSLVRLELSHESNWVCGANSDIVCIWASFYHFNNYIVIYYIVIFFAVQNIKSASLVPCQAKQFGCVLKVILK